MSIYNFQAGLRARLARMANEHLAMQEAILDLPSADVYDACMKLEAHSIEMSRLAKRLDDEPAVQTFNGSTVQGSESDLTLNVERLNLEPGAAPDPEAA